MRKFYKRLLEGESKIDHVFTYTSELLPDWGKTGETITGYYRWRRITFCPFGNTWFEFSFYKSIKI